MTSIHTNNGEGFFQTFFYNFFAASVFRIRLQARDELKRMSPSRPACENMVVDPVAMTQGAHNVQKREKKFY